jgi:hypothetical protein
VIISVVNKPSEVMHYDCAVVLKFNKILISVNIFNCILHVN